MKSVKIRISDRKSAFLSGNIESKNVKILRQQATKASLWMILGLIVVSILIISFMVLFRMKSDLMNTDEYKRGYNATTLVIQTDMRGINEFSVDSQNGYKWNKYYTTLYDNYEYYYFKINYMNELIPPYWNKVMVLHNILRNNDINELDYILFLDNDAIIFNITKRINELFMYDNKYIIATGECADYPSLKKFNSGVFAVKVNDITKGMIDMWWHYYVNIASKYWEFSDGKWICKDCSYGDQFYEQGSFVKLFIDNKDDNEYGNSKYYHEISDSNILAAHEMDDIYPTNEFIYHFCGEMKRKIPEYMNGFLPKYFATNIIKNINISETNFDPNTKFTLN